MLTSKKIGQKYKVFSMVLLPLFTMSIFADAAFQDDQTIKAYGVVEYTEHPWGTSLFEEGKSYLRTNPEMQRLCKEAGVKFFRFMGGETEGARELCEVIRGMGATPYVGFFMEPIVSRDNIVSKAVATAKNLKGLCNIYHLGNEPELLYRQYGFPTPDEYAYYFNLVQSAIKEIDPENKLAGPEAMKPTSKVPLPYLSWQYYTTLVEKCNPDFISFHCYMNGKQEEILARKGQEFTDCINKIRSITDKPLICGEWNIFREAEVDWNDTNFLQTAIKNAMEKLKPCYVAIYFCLASTKYPVYSMINPTTLEPKPQYYAFKEVATG